LCYYCLVIAYIFAYGSLLHPDDWVMQEMKGEPIYGLLENHLRHFQVGRDNQSPKYDQKHYLEDGKRSKYILGALGIREEEGSSVNGLAIPVDKKLFRRIHIRERSYYLSGDLRKFFSHPLEKPLFSYYPDKESYDLYCLGLERKSIFLPQEYFDYCLGAFASLGAEKDFLRFTKMPDYPLLDLQFYRAPGAI
jgi:hypothetical protein